MKQLSRQHPTSGAFSFFRRTGGYSKMLIAFFILFTLIPKLSEATHFRYGNISWTWVNGKTVTFHVAQSWRRSYFPGPPVVGSVVAPTNLEFGDGGSTPINLVVTSVNATDDWFYGEATITHTYANNGSYTAFFTNCCRISTLQNNHDMNFEVETIVNIGTGNSSPVSSMPPIINVQTGLNPAHFQLAASDPDHNTLNYRLATAAEIGGAGLTQPAGISINPTTGLISFITTGLPVGNLYNASFVVNDGGASIWVDVILKIVQQSSPPYFDYSVTPANGTSYDLQPGQNVHFTVKAADLLVTDPVTLQALGLPASATLSPLLPATGNPVQTSFSWTPTLSDLGSRVVNFVAQDVNGVQTNSSVSINVSLNPVFDSPPTPAANSSVCVKTGDTYTATIQAHAPDPNVKVQIVAATVPIGSPVFSPALPSVAGNTTSTVLTTTATGFGPKHLSFTATDNLGHSTTTGWDVIVNAPPSFTSTTPFTTISQNQPYSYAVTVSDPDISSGDSLEIHGVLIPSWMTFAQTGPTTGLLSGTPGPGDVGTVHIELDVQDIYDHCFGQVSQQFDLQVLPCTYSQIISASPAATGNCPGTPVILTAAAADSYSWSTGATTQSVSVIAGASTTYEVAAVSGYCSAAASIIVSGIDTVPPVASCQNITVALDAAGNASITPAMIDNGSSDACGIASMTVAPSVFNCSNTGSNSVVLTVTDVNGNVSTCNSTVTVIDNTAPAVVCQHIVVSLDASGNAVITAAQIDNGSSDVCGIASLSVSPSAFSCANVGDNTVTLTATDNNGNTSACTAIVTVLDNTPPVALCQSITVSLDGTGNAAITASQINNGSSDACGIASVTVSPSAFTCANVGVNPVTLTVTDNNGNVSTCTANVTVIDNTPPVAFCQSISVSLDATGNAAITASQIDNGSSDACGIASVTVSPSAFTCANVGVNPVTLTVTDINGNVSTCTSNVTVIDNTPPVALCQSITVSLDATGNATITASQIDNGSSDACGIASLSVSPSSFTCANVGANPVVLTVTDNHGNVSTCNSTVTVIDNTAPVALCQHIVVSLDASGNAVITAAQIDNGSNDACGIASLSVSPSAFSCANVGDNTVTLTVTDNHGNTSVCTAIVTVLDKTPPVALCQNITVSLDGTGNASITASQVDNGSSDACGIASLSVSPSSFTCANVGANSVMLTVTDNHGNVSVCSSVVTVKDNTPPVAKCQNLTVALNASGAATITASQIDNGSSDECGIASMSVAPSSFTCSNTGLNTVTLTVTDKNGNVSTCSSVVTVIDNTAPIARCQNMTVALDANGNAAITAAQLDNGSSDNCGIASFSLSRTAFTCANVGLNTVTLTVKDAAGNSASCSSVVTVNDNTAPVTQCKNITVALDASGKAVITAAQLDNGSSDNCGIASYSLSQTSFTCANVGANTVTLTVTDTHGNSSSCSSVVTVTDNTAPVALCKPVSVTLINGVATITAAQVNNGSSDNCGIASLSVSPSSFTCANIGNNTVTLTVTDTHGNISSCQSTVTVSGLLPTCSVAASHPASDNVFTGGDPTQLYLGYGPHSVTLTATARGGTNFTYSWQGSNLSCSTCATPVFTPTAAGVYTFTVTITNNSGCSSICSISICVMDVRVAGNSDKVYLCHVASGKSQTLSISVNAVDAHLRNHAGDHLGSCNQVCGQARAMLADEVDSDVSDDFAALAYPNPFSGRFHLQLTSGSTEAIDIRILSITGQLIQSRGHVNAEEDITLGSEVPNGFYFLEIRQGNRIKVLKLRKAE